MRRKEIVTAAHARWIGRVAVEWAKVETAIIPALEAMMSTDRGSAMIVFWHMNANERMTRLRALFSAQFTNRKQEAAFNDLWKRLEIARDVRNTIIHSIWRSGKRAGSIASQSIKARGNKIKVGGFDYEEAEFTVQELKAEAFKLRNLNRDFRSFFRRVFKAKYTK
jgi:hypothetical protein